MWLLAALLIADSTFTVPLPKHEYVAVSMTGAGPAVVMIPGLFGSAYGFRRVVPLLADAGCTAVVIGPRGLRGPPPPPAARHSTARRHGASALRAAPH